MPCFVKASPERWSAALALAVLVGGCLDLRRDRPRDEPDPQDPPGPPVVGESPCTPDGSGDELGTPLVPGDPGAADVSLVVCSNRTVHSISPLIYGTNATGITCRDRFADGVTACRLGGNRWTAYNWETNASNAGRDYCFQNDDFLTSAPDVTDDDMPAVAVTRPIAENHAAGVLTVATVPIVPHVAADKMGGSGPGDDPPCSGSVCGTPERSASGTLSFPCASSSDHLDTRFVDNVAQKGAPFEARPDPSDGFVFQDEFVAFVKAATGEARVAFSMDNEPDLWDQTHSAIYPEHVTYAEVVARNVAFATAVKSVWPEAPVIGLVGAGYPGIRDLWGAPDARQNGMFIDYYLAGIAAASEEYGGRLIDYVDVHWYPEHRVGDVRVTARDNSPELVALRLQASRSFWDPTYVEPTWLSDINGAQPIRLLPTLRERIEARLPGTAIAVTEWDFGGGRHPSGAVATADVLGIFGREGVGLATLWNNQPFPMAAIRAFTNYDGMGGKFGDTSIFAQTSDVTRSAVYASVDAEDPERTVVIALNKTDAELSASIRLAHPTRYRTADLYVLEGGPPADAGMMSPVVVLGPAPALPAVAPNAFRYVMPPYSVSILVPKR